MRKSKFWLAHIKPSGGNRIGHLRWEIANSQYWAWYQREKIFEPYRGMNPYMIGWTIGKERRTNA